MSWEGLQQFPGDIAHLKTNLTETFFLIFKKIKLKMAGQALWPLEVSKSSSKFVPKQILSVEEYSYKLMTIIANLTSQQ